MPIIHDRSPTFSAASIIARKYRVSIPYARLIAELNGFNSRADTFQWQPRITPFQLNRGRA